MCNFFRELIENDKKFMVAIFVIIVFTGGFLWLLRFLISFGVLFYGNMNTSVGFDDFKIYYTSAKLFLEGKNFYDCNYFDFLKEDCYQFSFGYVYLPITLIVFIPFTRLPFLQAAVLFTCLNLIFLGLTIIIISKILESYGVKISLKKKILLYITIFLFYPINTSFSHGQINILLLLLLTSSYYYVFCKNKIHKGSLFLSLATIFKIWPIFTSFTAFISKKAKGFFYKSLLFTVFLVIVSFLIFGFEHHINYAEAVINFQKLPLYSFQDIVNPEDPTSADNVSLTNSILKIIALTGIFNNHTETKILSLLILFIKLISLFLIFLYFISKNKRKLQKHKEYDILLFTFCLALVFLFSNRLWIYYGSFLAPFFVIFYFIGKPNFKEKLLIFLSIFLFSIQIYVIILARVIQGPLASIIYIANPATYAYISFFILIFYSIYRRAKM